MRTAGVVRISLSGAGVAGGVGGGDTALGATLGVVLSVAPDVALPCVWIGTGTVSGGELEGRTFSASKIVEAIFVLILTYGGV